MVEVRNHPSVHSILVSSQAFRTSKHYTLEDDPMDPEYTTG